MFIKKSLSNKFLNGLIFVFNLWWNDDFESIIFVINVFIVIDNFFSFIVKVVLSIMSNVVVVIIFFICVLEMRWNKGFINYLFEMIKLIIVVSVMLIDI